MSDMDELVAWLRAQLDEDEQLARYGGGEWRRDGINSVLDADERLVVYGDGPAPNGAQADHIARHDPARVLAEVAARRRILDLHSPPATTLIGPEWVSCFTCIDNPYDPAPCPTVRLLALPYADRPGFRDEWRPQT